MNQQVAIRWAEALRSGQYLQTQKQLRGIGGFCCLGVLCEVLEKGESYADGAVLLPACVIELVSMKDGEGTFFNIDDEEETLWSLNDLRNKTFEEIADVIDSVWEQL